jgi:hypothetical protein
MKTKTRPARATPQHPELAPYGAPPHIAVAPGLLDHEHKVVREPGESDERYQSRCELVTILLDFAKKG